VRLRHPQVLGLPARHLAVHLGVAEQRGAFFFLAVLGGLALGEELAVAHPAVAAGDVEGDHDPVAGLDVGHLGANLLDDPHRLVAEDVALFHEGREDLVEVEVGAADRRGGDPDDRVGGFLDLRILDLVDADVAGAVPDSCLHRSFSSSFFFLVVHRVPEAGEDETKRRRWGAGPLCGQVDYFLLDLVAGLGG
jgi:hypothetical protein